MTVATSSEREFRLVRRTASSLSRRGIQFVRRASFGVTAAASLLAAAEASAQITLPPNLTIGMETVTPGLREGRVPGAFNISDANPGDLGIKLEPIMAQTAGGNGAEPWPDNITYIYTGQMNFPDNGTAGDGISEFAFAEHVDDSTQIKIDGIERLNNTVWNAVNTTGRLTVPAGWHDVEFRFGQGVGGAGPSTDTAADADPNNPWDVNLGFGVDFISPIEGDLKQPSYTRPVDNGSGNLFRLRSYNTDTSRDNQNVNVTANATLTVLQGRTVPLGALTVANGTTFTVDTRGGPTTFTETNVGAAASFAITDGTVVTGPIKSAAAVTSITKTGAGTLSIPTRSGSTLTGTPTINVNGGTLNIGVAGGTSSLGTNAFVLNGGTLALSNDALIAGGPGIFSITGEWYRDDDLFNPLIVSPPDSANAVGWIGLDSKAQLDTKLTGRTAAATRPIATEINFPRAGGSLVDGGTNDEPNDVFNTGGANVGVSLTGNDDFATRFTGKLNVTTAGATEFLLMSNDGAAMFLDMDTGPGVNWQKVVDNNRHTGTGGGNFQGHYSGSPNGVTDPNLTVDAGAPAIPNPAAPNLAVGVYDFIVGSFNKNANEYGIELFWTPSGGTRSIIPFAGGGPVTLANSVTVNGTSGLDVRAPSATLSNLRMAPGSSLTVSGNQLTTSVTATGPGTVSIGGAGLPVRISSLDDGGNAVHFAAGNGRVELTNLSGPGPNLGATSSVGTVTGGTLVAVDGGAGDSLGDAQVTLAGGTLEVRGDGTLPLLPTGAGLHGVTGRFYRDGLVFNQTHMAGRTDPTVAGWSVFASVPAMDAGLGPLTPQFNNVPINVPLNFPGDPANLGDGGNDDEGGNIFAQSGIGVDLGAAPDINFAVRFAGKLNVTQAGPTRFTVGTTDGGVMFLDLDTGPGTNWLLVADNNRYGGVDTDDHEVRGTGIQGDPPITQVAAPNLAAGAYDFVVGFSGHNNEVDGIPSPSNNEAGIEVRWTPVGGGESIIPIAASGPELTFGNNIRATENSTINLGTSAFSASFGNIRVDAGKTLTSTGGGLTGGLKIAGSIGGSGTLRADTNHTIEFTRNGAASTDAPNLAIGGTATMRFNPGSGNTFGGGSVAAVSTDGLLHAASGITDLSGATVTSPNPSGFIANGGLSDVTGRFYNSGLTFNRGFTTGRTDPAVNGWSVFGSVAAMDAALGPLTPAFNVPINTPLNFPGDITNLTDGGTDDDPGNIFAASGIGVDVGPAQTTNFAVRFAGKLNVTQSGPTSFEVLSNDGAAMFVDLDTGSGTNWAMVADNNRFAGADGDADSSIRGTGNLGTPPIAQIPAPNLTVGQYDFIVGFFNHNDNSVDMIPLGNDQAGLEVYWTPAGRPRSIIPPAMLAAPPSIQVDGGATLRLGNFIDPGTVNIAANGRLELHGATSKINPSALNIAGSPVAPTGTLDLTDSAIVLDYPAAGPNPAADVRSRIIAGRGAPGLTGTWDGKGITSSTSAAAPNTTSVGYAVNADMPLGAVTTFRGVSVDPSSVLIRHTRIGDANLDGVVNDDDVTIVGATYAPGVANASWANGDFDYNGFVDDDDVTLLGALYDPSAAPIPAPQGGGVAAVPEPATWLMLTLGGLGAGLVGWRRRKK